MPLEVHFHNTALSICQLPQGSDAPVEILSHPFAAFFRAHNEVTLICPTGLVPQGIKVEHGFIPFGLVGPFEFGLTGILTQVANPLAAAGVSIVPLSTFDADYVLIKAEHRAKAIDALRSAGHVVHNSCRQCENSVASPPRAMSIRPGVN
jgi:hypothetical protein